MTGSNGLLLVDKSAGMTSHDVVARLRRLLNERRIGHAGTLDPLATGLLIVAVGPATRLLRFAQAEHKVYSGTLKLGIATDSLDSDGAVINEMTVPPLDEETVRSVTSRMLGSQLQTPPMVSAIKVGGRRLHQLAREGIEVERAPRNISIFEFTLRPTEDPSVWSFLVRCSVGTYIRVLLSDAAEALGTVGHLTSLRRLASGFHTVDHALTLESIERALGEGAAVARPPAEFLGALDRVVLLGTDEDRMRKGQRIELGGMAPEGEVAAYSPSGALLGVLRARGSSWQPEIVLPPDDVDRTGRLQS